MGDQGSKKIQESSSVQKDNRTSAGEWAFGGENNHDIVIGSDELAGKALLTVKDLVQHDLDNRLKERALDGDLFKVFAQQNSNLADSTLASLSHLSETKITDGANLTNKTTLIAIAVAGAIFLLPALRKS